MTKKKLIFFQKRFLIKWRCVIYICGFYGSANMGAAGQIVAKMNKTGHCPSWFFQPHPTPSEERVPSQALGDTASGHPSTLQEPSGKRPGRQSRALTLKVWSSPRHISTTWKYRKCKFPGPAQAYRIRNSEGAAQLPGFPQALWMILTQAAVEEVLASSPAHWAESRKTLVPTLDLSVPGSGTLGKPGPLSGPRSV